MKTEFKTKFLQHLIEKREEKGFTLIELLVVIIIIGILSAIALPSFLNQANKAKESEAKQYTGALVRAQQSYIVSRGVFSSAIENMGIGIKTQTINYVYSIESNGGLASDVVNMGSSTIISLRSYAGGVGVFEVGENSDTTSLTIMCEERTSSGDVAVLGDATFNFADDTLGCSAEYTEI